MDERKDSFFVGWAAAPEGLRWFLGGVGIGLIVLFAAVAYVVAATQDDPGGGAFAGRASVTGILQARPYPVVHVMESEKFAVGDTVLLTGSGKRGVQGRATEFDGALVRVAGARMKRGDISGLQLAGGGNGLKAVEGPGQAPDPVDLGRWRLTGEICDGKCLAGAMRPGTGLAHKACANLCLTGGVPPVFVSTDKVDGTEFMLMADADGGPVTDALLDHTATLVEAEGRIERRGSLLVFAIDPDTLRLAR